MSALPSSHPESKSSSRRALLAGALGGIGAWAASAIGRASPVEAANGDVIHVGDALTATSVTKLTNTSNAATVLRADSDGGIGVHGISNLLIGVRGSSSSYIGVVGDSTLDVGVYGQSTSETGVFGLSSSGHGVRGTSDSFIGVRGTSDSSTGVNGSSTSGVGIYGVSLAGTQPGIAGQSAGDSTGVQGFSGAGSLPIAKAKTGVYGYANQDSGARGIFGQSSKGYAGYFLGKVYLSKFAEMTEITTPNAPAANKARLFLKDNGSGKTQLCVMFNTGSVQVLATQP
jgi:hypothetical protein